ncbi:MAG: VOC family protein [Deltaproteobacteria bacterium]|nr:VOC family protein [Deltaproteobacteria bacterium]
MDSRPVVHFEIGGKDSAALRSFYSELFAWKFDDSVESYHIIEQPPAGIGGGIAPLDEAREPYVTVYVEVEDVAQALDRAASLGGTIIQPATEVPNLVKLGMFSDPEGNRIGVVQRATKSAEADSE